jgi:hypothetical protein
MLILIHPSNFFHDHYSREYVFAKNFLLFENMGTSYLEAMSFMWNHNAMERHQFYKLSGYQKICKIFVDCVVYTIAVILNVHNETKIRKNETHQEYDTFVQERQIIPNDKNVIVIFTIDLDLPVSIDGYKELEQNFTIIFHTISFANDIIAFLHQVKKQSNHIKAVWIRAHGSPTNISFNEYDSDNLYCDSQIARELSIPLDLDAIFILECCFSGRLCQEENIAQHIARFSNGRTVYAPSREMLSIDKTVTFSDNANALSSIDDARVISDKGWKVIMEGIQSSPHTGFLGRIHALWLMKKFRREDITMKFAYY